MNKKCPYDKDIETCYFGSVFGCSKGDLCAEFKDFMRGVEK